MSRIHISLASLTLAAALAVPTLAAAQAPAPPPQPQTSAAQGRRLPPASIPARMLRLGARLKQGAASGRITSAQQQRLAAALKSLHAQIQTARQNGTLTPVERRQIQRRLNRLSLAIARAGRGSGGQRR